MEVVQGICGVALLICGGICLAAALDKIRMARNAMCALGFLLLGGHLLYRATTSEAVGLVVVHQNENTHRSASEEARTAMFSSYRAAGERGPVGRGVGSEAHVTGEAGGPPASPTYLAHVTGDPARFAPTVETLVTWGLACGLDPIDIRAQWAADPAIAEHWATVCQAMTLNDVLSYYATAQYERWKQLQPSLTLSSYLGPDGLALLERFSSVPREELLEAIERASILVQDTLWGLGDQWDTGDVPSTSLELPQIVSGSERTRTAAEYLGSHIKEFPK